MNRARKTFRQFVFHPIQCLGGAGDHGLNAVAHHGFRQVCGFSRLHEMTSGDLVDPVVALVADGHRKLHLLALNLTGIEAGLRRQDIVERRQAVTPARAEKDAEVLGVPVGGADQPEQDLRLEKCGAIGGGIVALKSNV